jgi:hypothetical protein
VGKDDAVKVAIRVNGGRDTKRFEEKCASANGLVLWFALFLREAAEDTALGGGGY